MAAKKAPKKKTTTVKDTIPKEWLQHQLSEGTVQKMLAMLVAKDPRIDPAFEKVLSKYVPGDSLWWFGGKTATEVQCGYALSRESVIILHAVNVRQALSITSGVERKVRYRPYKAGGIRVTD